MYVLEGLKGYRSLVVRFDESTCWGISWFISRVLSPYLVWKRSTIDKDPSQLVHLPISVHMWLWGNFYEKKLATLKATLV